MVKIADNKHRKGKGRQKKREGKLELKKKNSLINILHVMVLVKDSFGWNVGVKSLTSMLQAICSYQT